MLFQQGADGRQGDFGKFAIAGGGQRGCCAGDLASSHGRCLYAQGGVGLAVAADDAPGYE